MKSPSDIQSCKKDNSFKHENSNIITCCMCQMDSNRTCCKDLLHILLQRIDTVPGSLSSSGKASGIEHLHLYYLSLCLCL